MQRYPDSLQMNCCHQRRGKISQRAFLILAEGNSIDNNSTWCSGPEEIMFNWCSTKSVLVLQCNHGSYQCTAET